MTKDDIAQGLRICGKKMGCGHCPGKGLQDPLGERLCTELLMLRAAALIEQQDARIAGMEAKVPRWIPVEERLPEVHKNTRKSDAMLVYTRRKLFMVAVWNGIDWLAPMDFWNAWGDEIVYWMPLPEAPKEGT